EGGSGDQITAPSVSSIQAVSIWETTPSTICKDIKVETFEKLKERKYINPRSNTALFLAFY
ncbi:hypothetical protein, partial [Aeromonas sp. JL9]|uniref:hypothetical protein n=1 Tax=Aeromonas sp. JL9 TaxID=2950549 RepID=UPI00210B1F66